MNEPIHGAVIFLGGGLILAVLFFVGKAILAHWLAHEFFAWLHKRRKAKEVAREEREKRQLRQGEGDPDRKD